MRVASHKTQPAGESSKTIRGRLCFTAFCIKYEVATCKILSRTFIIPRRIIYYSRYQRYQYSRGIHRNLPSDVFSIGSRAVSLSIPAEYHYPVASRCTLGSITVRGILISQPNEVSILFFMFFLRPVFLPIALAA